jgi:hypothetical protein
MDPLAYDVGPGPTPTPDTPYEIELVDASGTTLPTFNGEGRFYVLGHVGQRYSIRVRNPTASRVEAVISVDGLDVIDGETAAITKRGYIVAPYSEIKVDGFRVSNDHVAAFRFSSVGNSYAGRKGQARNVGVVGVALFAERAEAPMILPEAEIARRRDANRDRWGGDAGGLDDDSAETTVSRKSADRPTGAGSAEAPARRIRPAPRPPVTTDEEYAPPHDPHCCRDERPGLGTEFGERRHSSVRFTRFVRANQTRPTAFAELRYNDRDGLAALGITPGHHISDDELTRRETAEPFPGYAQPPR